MKKKYVLDSPKPDYTFHRLTDITPDDLRKMGAEAAAIDIDNTLTPDMAYKVSPEGLRWVESMKNAGIPVIIVSNTFIHRAIHIALRLKVPFIAPARKPNTLCLRLAAKRLKIPPERIAMIGDQIFADCLCANRVGAVSVRVDPFGVETLFARHHAKRRKKEEEYWKSLSD